MIASLPDRRAVALPDEPFSAYCKVCWYPIYTLWIAKESHGGVCMHECTAREDCSEAAARDRNAVLFARIRADQARPSG